MLKYELDQVKFSELKDKIEIPKFQRGLVWGDTKKKEFIKSLKAGLPIGVLLLSKTQNGKFLVIDGLQRFTTMLEYSRDYFSYIDPSEITDSDVISIIIASSTAKDIYDLRPEQDKQMIREKIRRIIVEHISTGQNKNLQQISKFATQQLCKDIPELSDKDLFDVLDKKLNFSRLKDAIIETAKSVQNALGEYIIAPTKKKTSLACHSELQLASYIVVLFKLRYDISIDNGLVDKGNKAKEIKEVKRFLYKHYLYDILRGHWSGSGDTKLEEIITDPVTCRYVKDVNKDSFEQVISEWLISSNKKSSLATTSAETKLFLNYLLRMYVSPADIAKTDYDIEHCVPKKVLQSYFVRKNIAVPICATCNLVYIPKSDNRGKGELTYYQKQQKDAGTYTLNADALAALSYPRKKDLEFVESVPTLTAKNYFAFLEDREKYITHRLIAKMYEA